MKRKQTKKKGRTTTRRQPARKGSPAAKRRPAAKSASPRAESSWAPWFVRQPGERRYWLVKSEPEAFSIDDLAKSPGRTSGWDGVRNFAARNFLRTGMKLGDRVFFYHSSAEPPAIVGICEVVREGYPDHTAFDSTHHGYDAGSNPNDPKWFQVGLRLVEKLARPVTLGDLKARTELAGMVLLRIGRLSVTPVSEAEWRVILSMAA